MNRFLIGTLAALGLLSGCYQAPQTSGEMPPAAVTTVPAESKAVPVYLDQIGNVAATETVTLRSQVSGKVIAANFVEGSDVKKGQVLFEIDPRPFQATLAQASASLAQAQASRDTAHLEFDRMEAVKNTSAISETEYDQKKGALAVAEAQVIAAQANVETAQLNLEYCTIKSPMDGRTGQRLVDPGNLVKENDTNLVNIQKLTPIFVDFTVTEDDLPTIKKYLNQNNLKVEIWLPSEFEQAVNTARMQSSTAPASAPATAPAPAIVRPTRLGELVFIDNAIREGTGTIKIRASVPNQDRALWPGQYVRVRVVLTTLPDAVVLPSRAVQIGQIGAFVYVVKDGVAEMRPVTVGQKHGETVVIESGVSAGEQVMITGQMTVYPGAKVMVMNGPATAAGAQPAQAEKAGNPS